MSLDPELLKQLLETFNSQLDEQSQIITAGLLRLEKKNLTDVEYNKTLDTIFRSAHNLKGASRSLGIHEIGEIAHAIETLFSTFKSEEGTVPSSIIDLSLEAVDKMHDSLQSFLTHSPIPFDLSDLLNRLNNNVAEKNPITTIKPVEEKTQTQTTQKNDLLKTETIRVTIKQIDRISALMEELQVNKIALDDHYADISQLHNKSKKMTELWDELSIAIKNINNSNDYNMQMLSVSGSDYFHDIKNNIDKMYKTMRGCINELSTLSNSLQEEIRMLRLVPAANLFSTLPRHVREMAHAMNKEIELNITGDEIKIDKMVLDGIKDPIIHILRNAVDHGIEDKTTREDNGKPPIGQINIKLVEEENHVLIYISDDGAGMNRKKIGDTILRKNLVTAGEYEKMTDDEVLDYIFHPGFSTKEIITDISGRGVGLNLVKNNLEPLKGKVTITTEINKGTTFCLSLPFTISSERGLMIKSGGEIFVVPTSHVERVFTVKLTDIIEVQGSQAIIVNGHPILLRSLAILLSLNEKDMSVKNHVPVVVIKKDKQQVGFLVDEVIGEREIIIKPLQYPFTTISCVAGGTLSGSSHIIVVLNSGDLLARALHTGQSAPISFSTKMMDVPTRPHILVVDDSITTRTLEKHVLESKNYQVTVAVDGQEAWDLLQKQKFSLLITDVMMPIMDGFTLTEYVKKNEKTRSIPVIIVTSLGSDAEKKRGVEVGADAYIVKNDFESSALLEIVSQLV